MTTNNTIREKAMQWWNNLADLRKTQLSNTNTELLKSNRRWDSLTGREIEAIWEKETQFVKVGDYVRIPSGSRNIRYSFPYCRLRTYVNSKGGEPMP